MTKLTSRRLGILERWYWRRWIHSNASGYRALLTWTAVEAAFGASAMWMFRAIVARAVIPGSRATLFALIAAAVVVGLMMQMAQRSLIRVPWLTIWFGVLVAISTPVEAHGSQDQGAIILVGGAYLIVQGIGEVVREFKAQRAFGAATRVAFEKARVGTDLEGATQFLRE